MEMETEIGFVDKHTHTHTHTYTHANCTLLNNNTSKQVKCFEGNSITILNDLFVP